VKLTSDHTRIAQESQNMLTIQALSHDIAIELTRHKPDLGRIRQLNEEISDIVESQLSEQK